MLINFKVTNFRSIKDEQILSLVANNYDITLPQNLVNLSVPGLKNIRILKGVGIYGANASGKSNVLEAIYFMASFIAQSAMKIGPSDSTGVEAFCLDSKYRDKPSSFEVNILINGIRYNYGFSLNKQRIIHEFLIVYPKGFAQRWFDRSYNEKKNDYYWEHSSINFKLDKDLREKTRQNSLFLSTGAQFNNEQLIVLYSWFNSRLKSIDLGAENWLAPRFTASLIENKKPQLDSIINLLRTADFGITGARVQQMDVPEEEVRDNLPPSMLREIEKDKKLAQLKVLEVQLKHQGSNNEESFIEFLNESAGTRRFFSLIGFWLDMLEHGYTVLLDELETSLHPLLVIELLRLLFSKKHNPKGAQIIFTTHNPILLENDLIRRDQVWFTEKDKDGSTHLYPLTDYKPRNNESLIRGYLAGRYGALPFIPDGLKR